VWSGSPPVTHGSDPDQIQIRSRSDPDLLGHRTACLPLCQEWIKTGLCGKLPKRKKEKRNKYKEKYKKLQIYKIKEMVPF